MTAKKDHPKYVLIVESLGPRAQRKWYIGRNGIGHDYQIIAKASGEGSAREMLEKLNAES